MKIIHHGPIQPDCPIDCLSIVLSMQALNPLARAENVLLFAPPKTVADVMDLHARGQLKNIRNLGARRISEIEAALVLAGLQITSSPPDNKASSRM